MPREVITVQVGQCGNQVGRCFWDLVLQEHASVARDGCFDEAMSAYFRNVDARTGAEILDGHGSGLFDASAAAKTRHRISCLKARAVLVDTEEGVLGSIMQGPLRELFDEHEFIKGVSGESFVNVCQRLDSGGLGHRRVGSTLSGRLCQVDSVKSTLSGPLCRVHSD